MEYDDAPPPTFTQPVEVGDIVTLEIETLGLDGDGMGRIQNYVVFVPGSLAGEEVEVEILSAGRKNGRAVVRKVLQPAPERTEPDCQHFGTCGGCQMQHMSYAAQLAFKTQAVRSRLQHALERQEVPVRDCLGPETPWGHRNRIAMQVTEEFGQLVAGLYQRRSRRVIPIEECPVSDPNGLEIATEAVEAARGIGIDAWDARTDAGTLRTVLARTNAHGETALTIIVRERDDAEVAALADAGLGSVNLAINLNRDGPDRLLGKRNELIAGDRSIRETVGGVEFRLAPAGWFRNSHFAAEAVAATVRRYAAATKTSTVVDLYAGMGFFAFLLAKDAGKVFAVEENDRALADARESMRANGIQNVELHRGKVEKFLRDLAEQPNTKIGALVLDPPKDGCGRFVLNAITKDIKPERVIYVSQNPATFAEEVAVFTQRGYNLAEVQPIDAGPHTGAIELVALLDGRIVKGKRRSSISQARRLLERVRDEDRRKS